VIRVARVVALVVLLVGCTSQPTIIYVTPPPTATPTAEPTEAPTPEPTEAPTPEPTEEPTPEPTEEPTAEPTEAPTEPATACAAPEFPADLGNDHLDQGVDYTGTYSSDPPTSGPHDPIPTETGTMYGEPQRPEELVHAMEHGAVVFWVNGLTTEQEETAQTAVNDIFGQGYESLIWVPYPQLDVPLAMTAWGVLQKCADVDTDAMQAFVDTYYGSGIEGFFACGGAAAELPACTTETEPTAAPSDEATFPDAAEAALLERVPEAIRDTCVRPVGEAVGAIADVDCFPEGLGADQVSYSEFPTTEAMNASYEETRGFLEVESDQGTCGDSEAWPAEGTYTIGGEEAGRLLCTEAFTGSSIIWWTDTELNIKSLALDNEGDREALYQFWLEDAGPDRP
jgi:hypothetical protein